MSDTSSIRAQRPETMPHSRHVSSRNCCLDFPCSFAWASAQVSRHSVAISPGITEFTVIRDWPRSLARYFVTWFIAALLSPCVIADDSTLRSEEHTSEL